LDVIGGCGPYAFLWSDGDTSEDRSGLAAGTYDVIITGQNGCVVMDTFHLAEPDSLSASFDVSHVCDSATLGSVEVTVGGGCPPYHFSWSTGDTTAVISGLVPGTYSVTMTDQNGCVDSFPVRVSDTTQILACLIEEPIGGAICSRPDTISAAIFGGFPGYSYNWDLSSPGLTWVVTGSTMESELHFTTGEFGDTATLNLVVTDSNGCVTSCSRILACKFPDGMSSVVDESGCWIRVEPNPVMDMAMFTFAVPIESPVRLSLHGLNGGHITDLFEGPVPATAARTVSLRVGELPAGTYLYRLSSNECHLTGKLVVMQ
jgi:hypothetical protein